LERVAKRGYTFAYHLEREEEKAKRAAMKSLSYGAKEHERNPFRLPSGRKSLTAQSLFTKENPAAMVEFYKREAQPLQLFWSRGTHT
jgi:hypothetical protein